MRLERTLFCDVMRLESVRCLFLTYDFEFHEYVVGRTYLIMILTFEGKKQKRNPHLGNPWCIRLTPLLTSNSCRCASLCIGTFCAFFLEHDTLI